MFKTQVAEEVTIQTADGEDYEPLRLKWLEEQENVSQVDAEAELDTDDLEDLVFEEHWLSILANVDRIFPDGNLPALRDPENWLPVYTELDGQHYVTIVPLPRLLDPIWAVEEVREDVDAVLEADQTSLVRREALKTSRDEQQDLFLACFAYRFKISFTSENESAPVIEPVDAVLALQALPSGSSHITSLQTTLQLSQTEAAVPSSVETRISYPPNAEIAQGSTGFIPNSSSFNADSTVDFNNFPSDAPDITIDEFGNFMVLPPPKSTASVTEEPQPDPPKEEAPDDTAEMLELFTVALQEILEIPIVKDAIDTKTRRTRQTIIANPEGSEAQAFETAGNSYLALLQEYAAYQPRQAVFHSHLVHAERVNLESTIVALAMAKAGSPSGATEIIRSFAAATYNSDDRPDFNRKKMAPHGALCHLMHRIIEYAQSLVDDGVDPETVAADLTFVEIEIETLAAVITDVFRRRGNLNQREEKLFSTKHVDDYTKEPFTYLFATTLSNALHLDLLLGREGKFGANIISTGIKNPNRAKALGIARRAFASRAASVAKKTTPVKKTTDLPKSGPLPGLGGKPWGKK